MPLPSIFETVLKDIMRAIAHMPDRSPWMCWRLHPDDFMVCIEESKRYCLALNQPWMPLGEFYLAGVRVFSDKQAPKIIGE